MESVAATLLVPLVVLVVLLSLERLERWLDRPRKR